MWLFRWVYRGFRRNSGERRYLVSDLGDSGPINQNPTIYEIQTQAE